MLRIEKNVLLVLVLSATNFFISAEIQSKSPDAKSVNISPVFTPTYNNNPIMTPNYHIENKPEFTNYVYSLSYSVGMKIKDISVTCINQLYSNATTENYSFFKKLIKDALWYYRYRIAGGTIIGSYSVTNAILMTDYYYLCNNTMWSRWKQELSFEDLCGISQKDLARELLLAIGQYYYSEKKPTDLTHPLIQFIHTIDIEIKIIKRYINTTKIINRLNLMKIFPTNDIKIAYAHKLLERALFIKHIFLSWLSEYNLTSYTKH
ncbi:MAG: hypothetical protein ABI892_03620 [Flavobacterium sp.]